MLMEQMKQLMAFSVVPGESGNVYYEPPPEQG
jgi:hypothetical protein